MKMSKHSIRAGDVAGLLMRLAQLKEKARGRTGREFPIIAIQEAGLDRFWIHRVLQSEGIESHVVDAASILTSRRRRRAKTDGIDGETLVRTLLACKRGEPRVCAMVKRRHPKEEDRRRICRERKTLVGERVEHVNRIKGLLFAQGVSDYEPLKRNRRARLEELKTGDGRPLPAHLKAQISRELDRLELVLPQLKKSAAPGVDGLTWAQYEKVLEANLQDLNARVHAGAYRALASRRRYIPKADGRYRPLGIAALEDKIVQAAVAAILTPVYEAEFLGFSYGFRPERGQHDALDAPAYGLGKRRINWILDADGRSSTANATGANHANIIKAMRSSAACVSGADWVGIFATIPSASSVPFDFKGLARTVGSALPSAPSALPSAP